MLFILDNSLIDLVNNSDEKKDVALNAIHRILEAWKYGNHLVLAQEELFSKLLEDETFNDSDKKVVRSLQIQLVQRLGSLLNLKHHILVSNSIHLQRVETADGKMIIIVNPAFILTSHITEQPLFLTENINEETFYRKVTEAIMFEKRTRFELSYLPAHGGGGSIFQAYKKYQLDRDRLCLAVGDSDKSHPLGELGGTASKLLETNSENLEQNIECVLCSILINEAREIENIIPTNILMDICEGNQERINFITWLQFLEAVNLDSRLFINVKDGFSFREIINSADDIKNNYWIRIFSDRLKNCYYMQGFECFANGCSCVDFSGMGPATLINVIEKINSLTPQKMNEAGKNNPALYRLWNIIGDVCVSWFCAPKQSYSV